MENMPHQAVNKIKNNYREKQYTANFAWQGKQKIYKIVRVIKKKKKNLKMIIYFLIMENFL